MEPGRFGGPPGIIRMHALMHTYTKNTLSIVTATSIWVVSDIKRSASIDYRLIKLLMVTDARRETIVLVDVVETHPTIHG